MVLIHGASLPFCACCNNSTWHPTSQTLALEAVTTAQEKPTALICYGTGFLFKSTPSHFKGHAMTSEINKWLMCYISVVRKEQIKKFCKSSCTF